MSTEEIHYRTYETIRYLFLNTLFYKFDFPLIMSIIQILLSIAMFQINQYIKCATFI